MMNSNTLKNDSSPAPCLNLKLRKASRALTRVYDKHLAVCGVNVGQFSILRAITFLEKTTNKELQSVLMLDQTTLSRNLKPLIRDGLLFTSEGEDRRQKDLQVTPLGAETYERSLVQWDKAQQQLRQHLGPEMSQMLIQLTDQIADIT